MYKGWTVGRKNQNSPSARYGLDRVRRHPER